MASHTNHDSLNSSASRNTYMYLSSIKARTGGKVATRFQSLGVIEASLAGKRGWGNPSKEQGRARAGDIRDMADKVEEASTEQGVVVVVAVVVVQDGGKHGRKVHRSSIPDKPGLHHSHEIEEKKEEDTGTAQMEEEEGIAHKGCQQDVDPGPPLHNRDAPDMGMQGIGAHLHC
jgi:hypothetical protein